MHIQINLKVPQWTRWVAASGLVGLVVGVGATRVLAEPQTPEQQWVNGEVLTAESLNMKFSALTGAVNELKSLSSLVPPGTVAAYAGELDGNPGQVDAAGNPPKHLPPPGWLWCNGGSVSRTQYAALFGVIQAKYGSTEVVNSFNLPDYRGRFLRGTDSGAGRDLEVAVRIASGPNGNTGDAVGSVQDWATGRPKTAFKLALDGVHNHADGSFSRLLALTSGGNNTAHDLDATSGEPNLFTSGELKNAPPHTHALDDGGDKETRPINVYVNYIIKY